MRKLTFDSIMDFYGKHNRSVFQKIVEAQRKGTLSPFVGAGLSVPFGYKLWGNVLTELAAYIPTEDGQKLAQEQIQSCKYEEAAGTILTEYPFMLDQLPEIVSPDILTRCPDAKKRTSAAWVLPYLFQRELVMTTNFDRVVEECYQSCRNAAIPTVTPMNGDRLDQLRLNQELCLLKLHGDIGREAVSMDDLVFTGKQYAEHYAEGSPLVSVLTQRFSSRRMLFLGCSLSVDRTMEVLKKVVTAQKGIRHFAVIGCKKADIPRRSKELAELGILPIFYDDSSHDAVRVILERLLEETDRSAYQKLCRSSWVAPPISKEERSLLFDAEYFPFSGREAEMTQLAEFCGEEDRILWWAVTGPGGMGKSRLVYEFCKSKRAEGWRTERFEAHPSRGSLARSLEELPGWTPEVGKTIMVLDDVQAHMDIVCAWMTRAVRCPRSEELRILLLERDGKDLRSASWLETDPHKEDLEDWCHDEAFLHLGPMTDQQLMAVMNDYAAAGKTLNAELLLKTLARIDPEFKRPLYAIAIADTRCQGKDPTNWDRTRILDTLLDRELEFHFSRLQGICKPSKTLKSELELLLANAAIRSFLPLDAVDSPAYKTLLKRMEAANMDPEEFFDRLGLLRTAQVYTQEVDPHGSPIDGTAQETEMKIITLSCPDLLKEHLVLKEAFEKKDPKLDLLPDGWDRNPRQLQFLMRLWRNHPDRLKDQTKFWERFFRAAQPSGLPTWLYGDLLWGCTACFSGYSQQAVDSLAELYGKNVNDEYVAVCYAKGLFNLICIQQSPQECSATVKRLEDLYHVHSDCQEVAAQYAKGLFNLLYIQQSPQERADTIQRLEDLHRTHAEWRDITIAFARGLVNLSAVQQSPQDCSVTIKQLEGLYHAHADWKDVVQAHATGLFNLSCYQKSSQERADTVKRLEDLYHAHSDLQEVATQYAKGLFNLLCIQQSPQERSDTVRRLENLHQVHTDWQEIATEYANSLVGLAFSQTTEPEVRKTLARSEAVLRKYPNHTDIQRYHAQTWFNLTLVQQEADIPATAAEIAAFLKSHDGAIPGFKEALDKYLSEHPDHTARYQPLLKLGGDAHG